MTRPTFFQLLGGLLAEDGTLSLRELLDRGGSERIYGLALTLLALLSFLPGVANLIALAILGLGLQMVAGRRHPWLPKRVLDHEMHQGKVKALLAKVEVQIRRLGPRREPPRPIPPRLLGLLVSWTALLLSLPLLLPFANVLPAAALLLMGIALLEDWPFAAWLGLAGGAGTTVYFALSFDLVLKALKAVWHLRHLTD